MLMELFSTWMTNQATLWSLNLVLKDCKADAAGLLTASVMSEYAPKRLAYDEELEAFVYISEVIS